MPQVLYSVDLNRLCRYVRIPGDLAFLHTLARTAQHRVEVLRATVLSSTSTGLGVTATAEVRNPSLRICLIQGGFLNFPP